MCVEEDEAGKLRVQVGGLQQKLTSLYALDTSRSITRTHNIDIELPMNESSPVFHPCSRRGAGYKGVSLRTQA